MSAPAPTPREAGALPEGARVIVLRVPGEVYALAVVVATGGAFLPYLAPALVGPWGPDPRSLALAPAGALVLHSLVHVLLPRGRARSPRGFTCGTLAPGAIVGVAGGVFFALASELRPAAYAALVANLVASLADLWEACQLWWLRPVSAREGPRGVECVVR